MGPTYPAKCHNRKSIIGWPSLRQARNDFSFSIMKPYAQIILYTAHTVSNACAVDHWFTFKVTPSLVPFAKENYHLK